MCFEMNGYISKIRRIIPFDVTLASIFHLYAYIMVTSDLIEYDSIIMLNQAGEIDTIRTFSKRQLRNNLCSVSTYHDFRKTNGNNVLDFKFSNICFSI